MSGVQQENAKFYKYCMKTDKKTWLGSKKLALAMLGKSCNELASHQQMILFYDQKNSI